jgi:hypothetical protein
MEGEPIRVSGAIVAALTIAVVCASPGLFAWSFLMVMKVVETFKEDEAKEKE